MKRIVGKTHSRIRVPASPPCFYRIRTSGGFNKRLARIVKTGRNPMKKLLTAIALTAFLSGTAFANSCPTHIKKIDEALATSTASEEVKAQAKALRDDF